MYCEKCFCEFCEIFQIYIHIVNRQTDLVYFFLEITKSHTMMQKSLNRHQQKECKQICLIQLTKLNP